MLMLLNIIDGNSVSCFRSIIMNFACVVCEIGVNEKCFVLSFFCSVFNFVVNVVVFLYYCVNLFIMESFIEYFTRTFRLIVFFIVVMILLFDFLCLNMYMLNFMLLFLFVVLSLWYNVLMMLIYDVSNRSGFVLITWAFSLNDFDDEMLLLNECDVDCEFVNEWFLMWWFFIVGGVWLCCDVFVACVCIWCCVVVLFCFCDVCVDVCDFGCVWGMIFVVMCVDIDDVYCLCFVFCFWWYEWCDVFWCN